MIHIGLIKIRMTCPFLEDKLMSEIEIHFAEIWKNAKILKKSKIKRESTV